MVSDHSNALSARKASPGNTIACTTKGYTVRKPNPQAVADLGIMSNGPGGADSLAQTLLLIIFHTMLAICTEGSRRRGNVIARLTRTNRAWILRLT